MLSSVQSSRLVWVGKCLEAIKAPAMNAAETARYQQQVADAYQKQERPEQGRLFIGRA